ncbi:hypothetical protein B0F90DRAFT_1751158 [Multifurca ochricompacta]|uniref:Uncharacterized protein n=1 Tax=Multifurca ochricompacta TaxID=376703 RepID=A0AAD4LYR5_9AGAM|nr:hypothetical protein B0F90DRAFT_1751158 [Multifurca ochricompacta]
MTDVPSAKGWLATDTPATKLLATRGAFGRMLLTRLQMIIYYLWRSLCIINGPATNEGIQDNVTTLALPTPQNTFPKKIYWSYFRGVSLALSELCQDCNYGGNPIPLSAILDLMRQHQSAFVPLGPHMEKDVPKRLIELANKHVVFFDPFEEYVIVPEGTREK